MSDALPLPPSPSLEQYRKLAKDIQRACQSRKPAAIEQCVRPMIENAAARGEQLPEFVRLGMDRQARRMQKQWDALQKPERLARCLLADAQFFIARIHGFASWPQFANHVEMLMRGEHPTANFERAADAIVKGDIVSLEGLLRAHPDLVRARSTREHRSTLLHYVSANGVEDFRQKTPNNIVDITRLLLDAGADVNATSDAYGGGSTTLGLAGTSVHPEQAGVQSELLELLLKRGASLEQPGYPLVKACLANGQGPAARLLASRGAALDLEDAAGVGRLDLVKGYFDENGKLLNGATQKQLESGFLYACGYGRTEVAEFLLARGVDPDVTTSHGQTALHWVAYGPHVAVAKLLLQHGANVNAKDASGRTPLQWALRTLASELGPDEERRARELVELLRAAGGSESG